MSKPVGTPNKKTAEFVSLYETLALKHGDPVLVLFKLMKSRTQSIKLQAAKELLSYRYPKQATATLELETAQQLVMTWEQTIDQAPKQIEDLDYLEASVINE